MMLDDQQIERFSRQIILSEIGAAGQECLTRSRILAVGLAPPLATALVYLAAAGIGEIGLADSDPVTGSEDLAAPLIFSPADIGRPRTAAAADTLVASNPGIVVTPVDDPVAALQSAGWHSVLCSATDGPLVAAVNRAGVAARTPLTVVAARPRTGWIVGLAGHRPATPCWECVREAVDGNGVDGGIEDARGRDREALVAGVIGAIAATEAIKLVLQLGAGILGRRLVYEPRAAAVNTVALYKDPRCTICGVADLRQTEPAA